MAYSELVKDFKRIRDCMREFFVYGFKNRREYDAKSARSYDNERRRMESWLGDYMSFRREASGKNVFISIDSRAIRHNPLYNAFKAKSFTPVDVTLHFYVMDILANGDKFSVREVLEKIDDDYLSAFENPPTFDESTVRKKLMEYEGLGLLRSEKSGKRVLYSLAQSQIALDGWREAVAFFSETDPFGVVGSYLLDKYPSQPDCFVFKHHYILHALESEILYDLLGAIGGNKRVKLEIYNARHRSPSSHTVLPLKIYISTQNGRRYLMAYHYRFQRFLFYRLDNIRNLILKEMDSDFAGYRDRAEDIEKLLWGAALPARGSIEHIEIDVRVQKGEEYIVHRLKREKRNGKIVICGQNVYRFSADVKDATEMLPWIRTFVGRIVALRCDNDYVTKTFHEDIKAMEKMYGVDGDVVL
jgi:DNA-binding transcriptional ArsR family regulator